MDVPVAGIDIACDFQKGTEPLHAPPGSRKLSFFIMRGEDGSILSRESHGD